MPETPGIYKFLKQGKIIYIGKAINLKKRLESYFSINLSPKTKKMVSEATGISFIRVTSELEALLLEAKLIKSMQPKYNFIAKDDKHALYIKITDDEYSRVITTRKEGSFGPFPSSTKTYSVLHTLRRIFPYADHKLGKRACTYNQIGLCSPCPNTIKNIGEKKKYFKNINHIRKILSGNAAKVIKSLKKEMNRLAKNEQFEEAVKVRTQIENLKYITQKSISENIFLENPNFSEDIKNEELKALQKILSLKKLNRIECYDVSHISGYLATASMVTFIKAEADKSFYRRFKIKASENNDVKVMSEIAKRRVRYLKKWGIPDLIFVDGGDAQAGTFKKVFDQHHIPVVAITKGRENMDFPNKQALNLVIRIRDESHRFAKKYHSLLFRKNLIRI